MHNAYTNLYCHTKKRINILSIQSINEDPRFQEVNIPWICMSRLIIQVFIDLWLVLDVFRRTCFEGHTLLGDFKVSIAGLGGAF